jgi:hypothetical protein
VDWLVENAPIPPAMVREKAMMSTTSAIIMSRISVIEVTSPVKQSIPFQQTIIKHHHNNNTYLAPSSSGHCSNMQPKKDGGLWSRKREFESLWS